MRHGNIAVSGTGKRSAPRALLLNLFDALIVNDGRIKRWTPRHDAADQIAA
jgi:hypothetical protein